MKTLRLLVVATALCAGLVSSAHAASLSWNGSASRYWGGSANWTPSGPPQDGDVLTFPTGTPYYSTTNNLANLKLNEIYIVAPSDLSGSQITLTNGVHGLENSGVSIVGMATRLGQDLSYSVGGTPTSTAELWFDSNTIYLDGHDLNLWSIGTNNLLTVSSAIDGVGNVTLTGLGVVRLNGFPKTYTGTTLVNSGTLELAVTTGNAIPGALTIGDGSGGTDADVVRLLTGTVMPDVRVTVNSSGLFDLNGYNEGLNPLILNSGHVTTGAGEISFFALNASGGNPNASRIDGEIDLGTSMVPMDVTNNASIFGELEIWAVISGTGGLIKNGTGELELNGANTYTGQTIINSGELYVGNSTALGLGGGRTTLNGGKLGIGPTINNEWLTNNSSSTSLELFNSSDWSGNIVLNADLNVRVPPPETSEFGGVISGSGGLIKNDTGTLVLWGGSPNTFVGTTTVKQGVLSLSKDTGVAALGGPLVVGGGSVPSAEVRWHGLGPQLNTGATVVLHTNGLLNFNGYTVALGPLTFNGGRVEAAGGLFSMVHEITVNPTNVSAVINGELVFSLNSTFTIGNGPVDADLQINATILNGGSGSLTFTKNGTGKLSLTAANSYSLATVVNDGVLEVAHPSALGVAGVTTTVNDGATLRVANGVYSMAESLILNGGGFNGTNGALLGVDNGEVSGDITLASASTIRANGNAFEVSGVISGTGPLTKSGPGSLRLSGTGANTYSGDTFVQDGVLTLDKNSSLIAIPGDLTIGSGVPFGPTATVTYSPGSSNSVAGKITVNRGSLYNLNNQFENFASVISGGSATPLTLNDGGDVQTGTGRLTLPYGTTVTVDPGNNGNSSISGRLGLEAHSVLGRNHTFDVGHALVLFSGTELTVSAALEDTGATGANVIKTGTGEMRLSGNNDFGGTLTVNGGRVTLASGTAAGATGGGVTVNNDGVLAIDGSFTFNTEPLTLNSTSAVPFSVESGTSVWNSTIALNQPIALNVGSGASLRILDAVSGSGTLTKKGPGTLTLAGTVPNTYTNVTAVHEGTLVLSNTAVNSTVLGPLVIGDGVGGANADVVRLGRTRQIANLVPVTVNASGVLDLDGFSDAFGSLAGSGAAFIDGTDLEVGLDNTSTTYSGVMSGAGGNFWKHGLGTLTLSGTNTYTGFTMVEGGGKLLVNGFQPQSPVTISNATTLGGSGTVGNITVATGGTVAPGASAGRLTCSNVTFSAGSTFAVELNGSQAGIGHDQLDARGTVSLGSATLNATLGFVPTAGVPYVILRNDSTDAITGTFSGLSEGAFLTIGGLPFQIRYTGNTGNDVTLTHTNPVSVLSAVVTSGNGNASFEPNECSLLNLVLTNKAAATTSNLVTTLVSETPGVTVTQPFSSYANLPNGTGRTNTTPFQISIAPGFPCGSPISLRLQAQTLNQGSFAIPVLVTNILTAAVSPVRFDNSVATMIPNPGLIHHLIAISNFNAAIARVEVSFFISHTVDQDLNIALISPNGTRVDLSTGNGGGGDNYGTNCADASRTRLSDLAAQPINGGGPTPPFIGTFRPEGLLADYIGKIGADVNGDWKFEVMDNSSTGAGDGIQSTGFVSCVSLFIYPAACAAGSGICELCPAGTLTGAIGSGSLQHADRLMLDGIASTCGAPKNCPGTTNDPAGPRNYAAHIYRNGPTDACITASLTANGPGLLLAVYTNSFDPLNLCANYRADSGTLTTPAVPTQACSFNVTSNQVFVVVVDAYSSTDEGDYLLTLTGGDCRPQVVLTATIGNSLLFNWTTASVGYALEKANHPVNGAASWPAVTNVPVVVNSRYQVTNSVTGTNQFYRLRKPLP